VQAGRLHKVTGYATAAGNSRSFFAWTCQQSEPVLLVNFPVQTGRITPPEAGPDQMVRRHAKNKSPPSRRGVMEAKQMINQSSATVEKSGSDD